MTMTRRSIPGQLPWIALVAVCLSGRPAGQPAAHAAEMFPAVTTNDLRNPHKGFLLWGTDYAAGEPDNHHGSSMFHVYAPWREVETADQAFAWDTFEANHLTPITNDYPEATFVLRLVADYPDGPSSGISTFYSGGEIDRDYPAFLEEPPLSIPFHDYESCDGDGPGRTPDWNDASMITQMVELIESFGAHFDGDPRLSAVQVGLLGLWGEWHQSGCDAYAPGDAAKIAVRDAFSNAFPNTPLQTRYPRIPDAQNVSFGFHEDYFPSFTAPCVYGFPSCDHTGDWNMDWCFENLLPGAANNWLANPISGESPSSAQKNTWINDADDIITVLRNYHFSFLGPAGAHDSPAHADVLQRIRRVLGYNLHIARAAWPDAAYNESSLAVSLSLTNSGSAPCYHHMPVQIALCAADGTPAWTAQWPLDPRTVTPGPRHDFEHAFTPSVPTAGVWSLRVGMLHPRRGNQPGVLFNSAGRDAFDRYVLGDLVIRPRDGDGDGMPDAWEDEWFGSTNASAGADADGDGQSNLDEWRLRTSPTDPASSLRVRISGTMPGEARLTWDGASGIVYRAASAGHPRDKWAPLPGTYTGAGSVIAVPLTAEATQRLFRVQTEP